jgi:hypothetical protein
MQKKWLRVSMPLLAALGTLGAVVLVVVLSSSSSATKPAKPNQASHVSAAAVGASAPDAVTAQVRGTVQRALLLHQTLAVPPGVTDSASPTVRQLDQQAANGKSVIPKAFGAGPASKEQAALNHAIELERTGQFRVLGGGISNLRFVKVRISATSAQVAATVTTWSKIALKNPSGVWVPARSTNDLSIQMTLDQGQSGGWLVQSFTWDFVPGTGP